MNDSEKIIEEIKKMQEYQSLDRYLKLHKSYNKGVNMAILRVKLEEVIEAIPNLINDINEVNDAASISK